jgi:hypothetical protein
MLVLNLFRATLTHIQPIAERLTLGPAQGAPYYALNTTPSTTSTDEFNTLVVTRRHPVTAVYNPACTAEIQPKLNLDTPGRTQSAPHVLRVQHQGDRGSHGSR